MSAAMGSLVRVLSDTERHQDIPLVWNAYEVAERAHRGQRRVNGDRYISHPIEVATIVARHGGTVPAVCAALLHDVIEDTPFTAAQLRDEFGPDIAALVEALTDQVVREDETAAPELTLVTIADRLHNMRTLRRKPAASRQRASLDTLVFHVPLAQRLDEPALATELADLACATLDALTCDSAETRRLRVLAAMRRADPRLAAEVAAALGAGAAVGVPEWALAGGSAGLLALVTAAVFGRDPRAARRLAEILAARRRN
jgi:(p)ppGpp synthase/HD superfamily hydrolase